MSTASQVVVETRKQRAKLTQEELAAALTEITGQHWDQSRVSRFERDPEQASFADVRAVAQVLGFDDPMELLAPATQTEESDLVHWGDPLAPLNRDVQALRDYVATKDWTPPSESVSVPEIGDLMTLCDSVARKPRLAFFGKFDVGKSTLVNTLLGQSAMPTSYQPATSLITYVRHRSARPTWLKEDVMILDAGFDPERWSDETHCREHVITSGGIEMLNSHGTHAGSAPDGEVGDFASVFIEAEVLKSVTFIDLPGLDNDKADSDKAKSHRVVFDAAIFADTCQGFLGQVSLLRLGDIVRRLPALERLEESPEPLSNLLIVATHAHPGISDSELRGQILAKGAQRAWRHLGPTALRTRAEDTGVDIAEEHLRRRFVPFYKDVRSRRQPVFDELTHLLGDVMPRVKSRELSTDVERFRGQADGELAQTVEYFKQMLHNRALAEKDLQELQSGEPRRRQERGRKHDAIVDTIAVEKRKTRSWLERIVPEATSAAQIRHVIEQHFSDKKDAQDNAAALVVEQVQDTVEHHLRDRTEVVVEQINDYLSDFERSTMADPDSPGAVTVPFNAPGAFAGGLVGLAGVGGLAIWASTLGNLGAYIIMAKAVSALSAVGISTGGTAAATAAMAALGGPVVVGIGIVVVAAVLGWALLRSSWQDRLAKKIASELKKQDMVSAFGDLADQYWDQTSEAFKKGSEHAEAEWQKHLKQLRAVVEQMNMDDLLDQLNRLEELRRFFDRIPEPTSGLPVIEPVGRATS